MNVAFVAVTVVTVVAAAGISVADFARARFVLENSELVNVPVSWLPVLGALKLAGAAGLVVGLLGVRAIGAAAAAGLVLFFVGAVGAHLRARAFRTLAFPVGYLLLSVASLVLVLSR